MGNAEFSLKGYQMFRKDREVRRGGGVALYIKRTLSPYFRNLPLLHITIRLHLTSRLLKFMQWLARKQYVLCSW